MNTNYYMEKVWIPGEYDCWGLVREFYERELGVSLPLVIIDDYQLGTVIKKFRGHELYNRFEEIAEPEQFCVVLMARRDSDRPSHVGVFVDGKVLHIERESNTARESLGDLRYRLNILGFYKCHI